MLDSVFTKISGFLRTGVAEGEQSHTLDMDAATFRAFKPIIMAAYAKEGAMPRLMEDETPNNLMFMNGNTLIRIRYSPETNTATLSDATLKRKILAEHLNGLTKKLFGSKPPASGEMEVFCANPGTAKVYQEIYKGLAALHGLDESAIRIRKEAPDTVHIPSDTYTELRSIELGKTLAASAGM